MVLEKFSENLRQVFRRITGLTIVDKKAVEEIILDLQRCLLQADVDVNLVAEISARIKKKVLEAKLPSGLSLREYFIKILYEEVVNFLGKEKAIIELKPQKILLIGLFGSGKTTTVAKIARWFRARGLSTALVACDTHRVAAQEQLKQLGKKLNIEVYYDGKNPIDIAKNALKKSRQQVLIFDSAGRDALDSELAKELKQLGKAIKSDEVLLVIPADLGQVARKQTEEFNKLVGITGLVVTKLDGTAKGGAAIAACHASNAKVKFIGVGEKLEDLEAYDPQGFVSRLIGYGDLASLLEKAKEVGIKEESAEKLLRGEFTLDDFYEQISSMQKLGSLTKVMEMVPGASNLFKKLPAGFLEVQEEKMKKWKHIIQSMTKKEKENPQIVNTSRIKRISSGAAVPESDVRELLKYYKQAKKVIKLTKGGKGLKRGPLAALAKQFGIKIG